MSDPLDDPAYTTEPVGGGAESVPDPESPDAPAHDIDGDDELGGDDTVAANDALDGGEVQR